MLPVWKNIMTKTIKNYANFCVGKHVTVAIPTLDCTSTDLSRLACKIVGVNESKSFFELACEHGILKNKFIYEDSMPYSAFVNVDESKTMTLREASLLSNPSNKSTSNKCHCKSKCNDDKRHSCKKNSLNCTNHCHPGRTCSNNCDVTVDCLSIGTNTWHSDLHMSRASQILKKIHGDIDGLQYTVLQRNCSWVIPTGKFIQFLHMKYPAHWITLSNIGQPDGTVNIYDSLNLTPKQDVVHTIAKYLHTPQKHIIMNIMNVDKQTNWYGCVSMPLPLQHYL